MLIKNFGQNENRDEESVVVSENQKATVEDDGDFSPVSEADIIAHQERLAEKAKQQTPVANFINSILNRKKEEKVSVDQFEKPKDNIDEKKQEKDQIEVLVEMAMKNGVERAIEAAKKSRSPYIMDAFHDRLIEEMRKNTKM